MYARRLLLCLALFLNAAAPLAQEAVEERPPATESPEGGGSSAPTADGDDAVAVPDAGDSPFDYEASEQISEDLSVSFPVDI
jgi:hypothetical protein